ncbi:DUF6603 domain-containing protein [Micromonospora sp. WMMA1923]|uniref:DUF6603 domain-containing protein n=1 Tax=Micromonospora sp. WMMA1923 TaxID=3404125 RepID=UPI003B92CF1C
MNRRDLAVLTAAVDAGTFDLAVDTLPARVAGYLGRFLPTHRITLTAATRPVPGDDTVVSGTGDTAPFAAMSVTIRFTLVAEEVTGIVVTATAGPGWSLADAFPALRGGLLADLRFDGPTLTLDSTLLDGTDPAPAVADVPMAFSGDLRITPAMSLLTLLFPGTAHPVTGTLTMRRVAPTDLPVPTPLVPEVELAGYRGHQLDLGPVTLTDLRYELVGRPQLNVSTIDQEVVAYVRVGGALPVSTADGPAGATRTRSVLVSAMVGGWRQSIRLAADFGPLGPVTMADIAGLLGQSSLTVPFGIDPGAGITLGEVALTVTPGTARPVDRVTATVYTQADWVIVTDLLTLEQIDVNVRVNDPFGSPALGVTVNGLVGIGEEGTLELFADPGTRQLGGHLREGDPPLRIREVYEHFTGGDPTHLPDLAVDAFMAEVALPGSGTEGTSFTGMIEIDGVWAITDGVELRAVSFALDHTSASTTFLAEALFDLHQVSLRVRAGYDPSPQRGWEFAGETGPGQRIPIGGLFDDLASRLGGPALPAPLAGATVENLAMAVSTGAKRLAVTGQARFPVDDTEVALTVAVDTAARSVAGALALAVPVDGGTFHPRLDVHFAQDPTARRLAASYSHATTDPVPELRALVGALSASAAGHVPEGVRLDLRRALFALAAPSTGSATKSYVFGVEVAATLDLAKLPVVGDHLTGATTMGVDPLRVIASTAALVAAEAAALNALLPDTAPRLPTGDLAAGFTVDATVMLGPLTQALAVPVGGRPGVAAPTSGSPGPAPTNPPVRTGDDASWITVQRSFGPLHIARVGLAFRRPPAGGARIALLLDASVTVAGLTLSLTGLTVEVSASAPLSLPTFDLGGIGLSYASGPLRVDGAFRKSTITYEGHSYPAYSGGLQLRTLSFSLGALGAYAQLPAGPSLFAYAFLNGIQGGPPFLSVRGLAAGFGYNRRFIAPEIAAVATFPLVIDAISGPPPGTTLADELRILDDYLPPSVGDYFLALGLRLNSFEMVDSFVLVAASLGHRFELDVLGLSTVVLPAPEPAASPVPPIAQVQLALRASIVPEDGYLTVVAQLTRASYLLSPDCHLTGGLAFSTWFAGDHAGDFALTAGGYHPHFPVPAHYPNVPRLGFSWQVCEQLSISGGGYFALTPSMLMAGGRVSAVWQDDSLRAAFDASMDFLLSWQPYHYEAALHVGVTASYTFQAFGAHTISVHVGTDVQLWGPDFGGTARIDLDVTSIDITFGAAATSTPTPLTWSRFRDTLLPPREQVVGLSLRADSHRSTPDAAADDLGIADPTGLVLTSSSAVPASSAVRGTGQTALPTGSGRTLFGVGPVDVAVGAVTAVHRIAITHEGTPVEDRFDYTPVRADLPYALWGGRLRAEVTDPALLTDLVTGYEIRPRPAVTPADPAWVDRAHLRAGTPLYTREAIALDPPPRWQVAPDEPAARAATIEQTITAPTVAAARAGVLAALLPSARVDLAGFDTSQFHAIPQVAAHV